MAGRSPSQPSAAVDVDGRKRAWRRGSPALAVRPDRVLLRRGSPLSGLLPESKIDAMCRLYGFRATEPTTVECTLVSAQNALIVQSQRDQEGRSNAHGWGVAVYPNRGLLHVE